MGAIGSTNLRLSAKWGLLWLMAVCTALIICTYGKALVKGYRKWADNTLAVAIFFTVLICLQLAMFVSISGTMRFDAGEVFQGVFAVDKQHISEYLSTWWNNIPIYIYEDSIRSIFGLSGPDIHATRLFVILNCMNYDLGFLFIGLALNKIYDRYIAIAACIIGFLCLGLTNQMYQFYTTGLAWPLTCLGLLLYVYLREQPWRNRKVALSLVFGVLVYMTYLVRPSSVIYIFAIVLVEAARAIKRNREYWLKLSCCVLAALVGIIMSGIGYQAVFAFGTRELTLDHDDNATMMQYAAYGITGFGAGTEDVRNSIAEAANPQERQRVSFEIWQKRLRELGFTGYANFLVQKHIKETEDGSFGLKSAHIEEKPAGNPIADLLQNIWYSNGKYSNTSTFAMQTIYILVLIGGLASVRKRDSFALMLKISLLGWYCFLLLFEGGRTGYTIQAFPVLIALSSIGWAHVLNISASAEERQMSSSEPHTPEVTPERRRMRCIPPQATPERDS